MEKVLCGLWINEGKFMFKSPGSVSAAPCFRKTFDAGSFKKAVVRLCGLGWHELYVNGQKADDRVLAPNVTQYDKRVSYIDYDVSKLIRQGKNAVAVILGNGWYNYDFAHWELEKAPWRDWPKLCCDILIDGRLAARSDRSWKFHPGPVTYDALHGGESYDARLEIPGFASPGLDDSAWQNAAVCFPPPGIPVPEDSEPCKVMQELLPVSVFELNPLKHIYDFGKNISGWCKITVEGPAGATVVLEYAEQLRQNGDITNDENGMYLKNGRFQKDTYTLKGDGIEVFQVRFTYHGFRYVSVYSTAAVKIHSAVAQFVHTAFASAGEFVSSDETLTALQAMTRQSYCSNFVGIPTDCPQREKNGWTGDANLACRTGLWNFKAENAYQHFVRMLADTQRPSGQLSCITPTGGWGFNWGSGPAWDSMLFEGVEQLWLFCGDTAFIEEMYEPMSRYLDYCSGMAEDGITRFGLGDWCHWDDRRAESAELTSTGYYYADALRMSTFAGILGKTADAAAYRELAGSIRQSFLREFHHSDGSYGKNVMTSLAAPLFFGLAGEDAPVTARLLTEMVRANDHKADFGILGAKFIPRVLADYGYADDAFKVITQPECPGWGYWVRKGATSLWEHWDGVYSQNHIMYGDISAWMFEYPGGLRPRPDGAGFKKFDIKPHFISGLKQCKVQYAAPTGEICFEWKRSGGKIKYSYSVPAGSSAVLALPGKEPETVTGKDHRFLDEKI